MIRFELGEVKVPNDGEIVVLGQIYEDDRLVSKIILAKEEDWFVIDCAFESSLFPREEHGKTVDESFIKGKLDKVCRSIQRMREAA